MKNHFFIFRKKEMAAFSIGCTKIVFFNFTTPANILEKYLPPNAKIDYFNGQALISLAGSQIEIPTQESSPKIAFNWVSLQFYVKEFDGLEWKKGTVPIAAIAGQSSLKEVPDALGINNILDAFVENNENENNDLQRIEYSWNLNGEKQYLSVSAEKNGVLSTKDSEAEFVLERPEIFKIEKEGNWTVQEITHPRWRIFPVKEHEFHVDFTLQFGAEFSHLTKPHSVIVSEGSEIGITGLSQD